MNNICLVFPTTESRDHWMNDRTFKRAGLDVTNYKSYVVKEQPVLAALNQSNHDIAILFGEDSLFSVLQYNDIGRWFNRRVPLKLKDRDIVCVPCYEPMRLLARQYEEEEGARKKKGMRHPPRFTGVVINLLKAALNEPYVAPIATTYLRDPGWLAFEKWVDDFYLHAGKDTILSWDIETPYKINEDDEDEFDEGKRKQDTTILRISFSYVAGSAVSVPHLPEYRRGIQRLLNYTGFHLGWNSIAFDVPVVNVNDYTVGGFMLDGMDAFHLYQSDLDKGLEAVSGLATDLMPWKHLNDVDPALYSCIDADAALRNMAWIMPRLEGHGLLSRFFKEMEIINILNEAGQRGSNIDDVFRLELKGELETEMYAMLRQAQGLVDKKFYRRKLYKKLPKGVDPLGWTSIMSPVVVSQCNQCGKRNVSVKHKCPDGHQWEKMKVVIEKEHFHVSDPLAGVDNLEQLLEALSVSGFNPCSSHQMMAYMKAHKHPVGQNYKTKKDTADIKHLQKLVKKYDAKHPIYRHTLKIRLLQKALSTYVNGLEPDGEGRAHTTYVNSPSTWRLGSRNINVQNLGKRNGNPYAKKARKIIIPSKDHILVQADSSAIEAVMVGWFMGDDHYIREARLGVHAGLCCKYLGIPNPTPEQREKVKKENPALYDQFKTVVHGTNFGMGAYMMHMNDPDKFPTIKSAEALQEFLFMEMKGLPGWHHQLRVITKKNGYLDNPWNLRHYFYDVFTYAHDEEGNLIPDDYGNPKVKLGKDGKRVIAFKPQSSAGMFMRDNIHLLGQTPMRKYMPAVVSIHDGYCLDVPVSEVDNAVEILVNILTRPIMEMDGLRIGCAVETSAKNFLEMEPLKTINVSI